ncbi:MAG: hypothetical protein EGR93_00240 [Prevotella sp.]|nr:hypothetical protein [Prevotella sp.]
MFGNLTHYQIPCMKFLFVRSDVCPSSLPGYIFLPAHARIFRGQGKIKVGTGTKKMKPNSSKITDG